MMDFIVGISLSDLLKDPKAERPTRLMREDISGCDIRPYPQADGELSALALPAGF